LQLHPVLPVILHTGLEPWTAPRGLRELMTGPTELYGHVPDWRPLFFDLSARTPEELLKAVGQWLPALAVVRAEREDRERFEAVLTDVLGRLADLHDTDRLRWSELLRFVLSWGLRRRPGNEQQTVFDAVLASHQQGKLREEMEHMAHALGQTWEQELLQRGREIGKQEGVRSVLLHLGRKRFGEPDAATIVALENINDLARLERMSEALGSVSSWADVLATL
jgi:hypothetical protein